MKEGMTARERGAIRASLFVVLATGSGSAANFMYQWIAARSLDDDAFSLLAAMLAVITICVLPGPPLSIAIVRRLTSSRGSRVSSPLALPSLAPARRVGIFAGLTILLAIGIGTSVVQSDRLHLSSGGGVLLWIAAAFVTVSWLVIYPDLARAQARGEFSRYGRSHALLSATRLGFGGGAILAGAEVWGALICLAPGPWLVRALLVRGVRTEGVLEAPWLRALLPMLAATGGLHALVVIDVVFARVHFGASDPTAAGAYAACATLARALFHLPFAATAVTVQRTAAARAEGRSHRSILLTNLGLVLVLVAIGGGFLATFPSTILDVFAGEGRYSAQAPWLRSLLVPMALASVAAVPAHYLLALGSRAPVYVLGIAPFVLAGLLARPPETPAGLIPPLIAVIGAVAAILLVCAWFAGGSTAEGSNTMRRDLPKEAS